MSKVIDTPDGPRARHAADHDDAPTRARSSPTRARDIERYNLKDYFIVDVDSHHVEFDSWAEVLDHIEDPVLRRNGKTMAASWPNAQQHRAQQPSAGPDVPGRARAHPAPDPAR